MSSPFMNINNSELLQLIRNLLDDTTNFEGKDLIEELYIRIVSSPFQIERNN